MIIANTLRDKNKAEYVLYMWQIEDIIRAYDCDIEKIKNNYINRFEIPEEQKNEMVQWYTNLTEMMLSEGVKDKGHLQINKNTIQNLTELHLQLLQSSKFPFYNSAYYKALPYIVEVRRKGADKDISEIETCFDVLYGVMLLRLQKKEVTAETSQAAKDITTLLGMLSDYYFKDKKEPLEF